jgi:hypothetical protein
VVKAPVYVSRRIRGSVFVFGLLRPCVNVLFTVLMIWSNRSILERYNIVHSSLFELVIRNGMSVRVSLMENGCVLQRYGLNNQSM